MNNDPSREGDLRETQNLCIIPFLRCRHIQQKCRVPLSKSAPPKFSQFGSFAVCTEIFGGIAQLGERLHGMQEVSGSIPLTSTS